MKTLHAVSLALGAVLALGMATMSHSNAQSPNHLYEMRTYHASPGKLEEVKARFRDHTIDFFNRHNLKSIGYWVPQDDTDKRLVYILEHTSRAEADKNWAAFNADPEWQKVKAASEANGPIVSKLDRVWMDPADFSAMK